MGKQREQSQAVIDDDGVAREIELAGEDHPTAVWREHPCAGRAQEVRAAMRLTSLAVEDAARAEGPVGNFRNRAEKCPFPQAGRRGRLPEAIQLGGLVPDARQDRRRWIDVRVVHA